jgi:predicted RNA-binding Zn ribbon-like protein
MATSLDTTRFRQGSGRLCLDFIRTVRHRGTVDAVDELADASDLVGWVRQFGPPMAVTPSAGATAVERARELREAILELVQAARGVGGAASCGRIARGRINQAAAHPVPAPSLDATGLPRWHADDPVTATLALVARDALDLATSTAVGRIHECAGAGCGALFLDTSRPGTRRWCSMDTCGNRAKKNTFRGKTTVEWRS